MLNTCWELWLLRIQHVGCSNKQTFRPGGGHCVRILARLLTGAREPAVQMLWPVSLNPWVYSIQSCARGRAGCECAEFQLVRELLWTPAMLLGL